MFLDFKLGILWPVLVGILFQEPITFTWLLAGVFFALLPDIDFWIELIQRGTVGGKIIGAHRTLLHNPLVYVPVILFVGSFFGPAWMTLFGLGVFGHFIHDSMGMGYGVRWLWPFSNHWFKIFSDIEGNIHYDLRHLRPISCSPETMAKLIGEKGNESWLKEELQYAKKHAFSIGFKFALFILALFYLWSLFQ
jgi:hypothetical protein